MQKEGPTEELLNRAKETARRNYETALKTNAYWLGRLQAGRPLRAGSRADRHTASIASTR